MAYPRTYAATTPDKPAVVMAGSGETITYRELEARSCRLAQLLWDRGLRPGDHLAILMENRPEYFEVVWAGLRSGLYVTTINRHLTGEEAGYILDDCEARALVTSSTLAGNLPELAVCAPRCTARLVAKGEAEGYESYEEVVAEYPDEPLADEPAGLFMLYSSGTTGRPKGIKARLPEVPASEFRSGVTLLLKNVFGFDDSTTYLCPAPLYHSAPMGFTIGTHALGGTVVVMEHFDPVEALATIEAFGVTHSQWVPTMFVRMLKLDETRRNSFDLSTHRMAIHAAAPCPPAVKEQMLQWWGPIIHEYYGGTESIGLTYVGPEDWLSHRGTVGRPMLGTLHICDDNGAELGPNEDGLIYFERPTQVFEYHNDPEKTRSAHHSQHPTWAALGDVGHVDEDGFLYLTDRASFMIVAGGVNIYPQEIENVLVLHPKVADVAVFGVPNEDLGEEVKAVVQLIDGEPPSDALGDELIEYAHSKLAHYKVPRSVDFVPVLPRLPTGKLYKRLLRDPFWGRHDSKIV
jgi:long-chain acyl-CoA synthetase